MKRLLALVLMMVSVSWGFLPPVDTARGVKLEITGVPEFVQPAEGVAFQVVATNDTEKRITMRLRCYMNDDWEVSPAETLPAQVVEPGATWTWRFCGKALPRVLNAWYPVHAFAYVVPEAGERFELHPIALFQVKASSVKSIREAVVGGEQAAHLATAKIVFDGSLDEWWGQATPVGCGANLASTGKIDGQSFDGLVMFLHDQDYIYVGGQVADDDISCEDTTSSDYMNSDYLRLYMSGLDPQARKDNEFTEDDCVVAVNLFGGADGQPLVKVPAYVKNAFPEGFEIKTRRTGVGYTFECRMPKATLKAGAAKVVGMNLMLGDADGKVRRSEIYLGRRCENYWQTPQGYFRLVLGEARGAQTVEDFELEPIVLNKQAVKLNKAASRKVSYKYNGAEKEVIMQRGFNGGDKKSGISAHNERANRRGDVRESISFHPPWHNGVGYVRMQFKVTLPQKKNLVFKSAIAIRDFDAALETSSDGVQFIVEVDDGTGAKRLLDDFTDTKTWKPVKVDLQDYAGKTIDFSLIAAPGPKNDTNCDSCFWAEPTIGFDVAQAPETEEQYAQRRKQALELALNARKGKDGHGSYSLKTADKKKYGVGVMPGREGLVDAVIVFTDGTNSLEYQGISMDVANVSQGVKNGGEPVEFTGVEHKWGGKDIYHHFVETDYGRIPVDVSLTVKGGVLLASYSMPGVKRDLRGQPRFTRVALGNGSERPWRIYAGFGNVMEDLQQPITITKGGFTLSTRHAGVDYKNGMSLTIASDFFPDSVTCNPDKNFFALVAHNDVTFYFAPSNQGAFAAAKEYGRIVGFKASPGMPELMGRQCMDQWGGDYGEGVEDAKLAGKYGLNHSIFVKHVWQRWGYDYRLPEVYPPAGNAATFTELCQACQDNGIIFAPHDNYIDFYPDAEGFSYDHIIFNADGTPQRAWWNAGRKAQSYRWMPHAFHPWLVKNMKMIHDGIGPHGLFIDVFTAICPMDYYDRSGRFYDSKNTAREWSKAFDTCREILWRNKAPMTSECGHDGLIGSLDGGQADHFIAKRWGAKGENERVPWHDIVTHGKMVLLGGGLAGRYMVDDVPNSGYASDNYVGNTLIGGRNPMSAGPFTRDAVLTYWMIHDVSNWLAHQSFDSHEFGDNVHRQHTVFGGGKGQVWTNRCNEPWTLPNGAVLGEYGYYAEVPGMTAAVVRRDGRTVGYSRADGCSFFDSRPKYAGLYKKTNMTVKVLSLKKYTERDYAMELEWTLVKGLVGEKPHPFIHITHPSSKQGEKIAFQGGMAKSDLDVTKPGTYHSTAVFTVPEDVPDGNLQILFGLFYPTNGGRVNVWGQKVEGSRVFGGEIKARHVDGKVFTEIKQQVSEDTQFSSVDQPLVDFEGVKTNGAFRLLRMGKRCWRVIPVPGSLPFRVEATPEALFGDKKAANVRVSMVDPMHTTAREPLMTVENGVIKLEVDGRSFAYQLEY